MNSKQYYETVDVDTGEFPEDGIDVICFASKRGAEGINGYQVLAWREKERWATEKYHDFNDNQDMHQITQWLRPVDLSELIRKATNWGFCQCKVNGNFIDIEKENDFINSLI